MVAKVVNPDDLRKAVDVARRGGYTMALEKYFCLRENDRLYSYALNENRGDWLVLTSIDKDKRILYLGALFGAVTMALARRAGAVVLVASTPESIDLVKVRAKEEGIRNIHIVQVGLSDVLLPFKPNAFDIVAFSRFPWEILHFQCGNGRFELNERLLTEACRVAKSNGVICIIGANKIGLGNQYIRKILHGLIKMKISEWLLGARIHPYYQVSSYSYRGYVKLLRSFGIRNLEVFIPLNNSIFPSYIVSFEDEKSFRYLLHTKLINERKFGLLKKVVPNLIIRVSIAGVVRLGKYFVKDYIMIGKVRK